jgi:hypothetical protein
MADGRTYALDWYFALRMRLEVEHLGVLPVPPFEYRCNAIAELVFGLCGRAGLDGHPEVKYKALQYFEKTVELRLDGETVLCPIDRTRRCGVALFPGSSRRETPGVVSSAAGCVWVAAKEVTLVDLPTARDLARACPRLDARSVVEAERAVLECLGETLGQCLNASSLARDFFKPPSRRQAERFLLRRGAPRGPGPSLSGDPRPPLGVSGRGRPVPDAPLGQQVHRLQESLCQDAQEKPRKLRRRISGGLAERPHLRSPSDPLSVAAARDDEGPDLPGDFGHSGLRLLSELERGGPGPEAQPPHGYNLRHAKFPGQNSAQGRPGVFDDDRESFFLRESGHRRTIEVKQDANFPVKSKTKK